MIVRHTRPSWRRVRWRGDCIKIMVTTRLLAMLFALLLCIDGFSWHASATTNPEDLAAIQALYSHWYGRSNIPPLNANDPCALQWAGMQCDNSGRVIDLYLSNFNLTGGIPQDIGDFAALQTLDLSYNELLSGPIPSAVGHLTSLQRLVLSNSGLTGPIPSELGSCLNLSFLALDQNRLSGSIPPEIGSLTKLYWFDISENQIIGPLPVSSASSDGLGLDNLTSAQHFHFNNNSINGGIPEEIFFLPKLIHVLLNGNSLIGKVPSTVASAPSLQILRLDFNQLSGALPNELGQATKLKELHLSYNSFSGVLPDLTNLTNLLLLDVSNNQFLNPEPVPDWMYSLSSIISLTANGVNFVGSLKSSIFEIPSIQSLSLSDNSLSGTLTFSSNTASSLVAIDLQNNNFTSVSGQPEVNGLATGIPVLVAGNPLCKTSQQYKLDCTPSTAPATWTPPLTTCQETCDSGQAFNPNLCNCAFPLILNMQLSSPSFSTVNNTFMSGVASEWAQDFSLQQTQVYIGYANFTSDGKLLFSLYFFPTAAGEALPSYLVDTIVHDIHYQTASLSVGPYFLRNYTLPRAVPASKSSTSIALIIGVVAAVVALVCILLIIVLYAIRQKRRADRAEVSMPFGSWGGSKGAAPGDAPQLKGARWFSLAELKKATNDFSDNSEIGAGGYGKVYKAVLPNGEVVAVKRAEEGSMQGAAEFKTEIELLSRVHHRNLVGLVGFCYESGEQMLVYEYMPNGTLREHLLGTTEVALGWDSRVRIALGSARGLAYLHELANPPIIHRDVKSSNILLDEKMVAKVADFGLSKIADFGAVPDGREKKHVSTQVKGTLGYLDPEYYMTNRLSEKSDVYSFGVLLLEILSGRQPIERGRYIVREARTALGRGGFTAFKELMDPFLADYPSKQLEAMVDLAIRCVEEAATDRPSMNEVVKELEVIAGHSNSGVHITMEPLKPDLDLYSSEKPYMKKSDPSFEYSGAAFMVQNTVEPK